MADLTRGTWRSPRTAAARAPNLDLIISNCQSLHWQLYIVWCVAALFVFQLIDCIKSPLNFMVKVYPKTNPKVKVGIAHYTEQSSVHSLGCPPNPLKIESQRQKNVPGLQPKNRQQLRNIFPKIGKYKKWIRLSIFSKSAHRSLRTDRLTFIFFILKDFFTAF